jgi:hypothetical protein
MASNYNTRSNRNSIPGRSETMDEPTSFSTPGSSQDTDAAGGLAHLRELREFQAQNPGFSTTAAPSGTPGIPSRQHSIIPGTGTSRETGNASDFPHPAPARPNLGDFGQGFAPPPMPNRDFLSNEQAQSLEAQRRTYFDLQTQLLQAEIDKAAALVARAKANALRIAQELSRDTTIEDIGKTDSPQVVSIAAAHPGIDRQYIRQIESNSFHPAKLYLLQALKGAEAIQEDTLRIDSNGTIRTSPEKPARSKFGSNPETWLTGFINYISISQMLHGPRFPTLVVAMSAFLNQIRRLSAIYKWQGSVLELAIEYHCHIINNGPTDSTLWQITPAQWVDMYCTPLMVRSNQGPLTQKKRELPDRETAAKQVCFKWNEGHCNYNSNCYRKHECSKCSSPEHPASKCKA